MSGVVPEALKRLREPFPAADIEWRVQQAGKKRDGGYYAMVLAYVTNRAIMERLDEVCGPENWRNEFRKAPEGGVLCGISINVGGEWVTKWDGSDNSDFEAVKGGLSKAMKRAGVQWGIGRYLYDLEEGWATINDRGSQRFSGNVNAGGGKKERAAFRWDPPAIPDEFLPEAERGRARGRSQAQPRPEGRQRQTAPPAQTQAPRPAQQPQADPAKVQAQAEMNIDACTTVEQLKALWTRDAALYESLGIDKRAGAYWLAAKRRLEGDGPSPAGDGPAQADDAAPWSDAQRKAIMAHYSKRGMDRDARLADMADFLGRDLASFNDLTRADASAFLEALNNPPA